MTMDRRTFVQTGLAAAPAVMLASCAGVSDNASAVKPADRSVGGQTYGALMEFMQSLEIIDTHEHLMLEKDRLAMEVDVLTLLAHYTYVDMVSAGYAAPDGKTWSQYNHALQTALPLEQRWNDLWPYIQQIQYGSYYRAPQIALREVYGIDDLNPSNYKEASEKIKAANTPGLYHRILRDKCRIKTCLVQNGRIDGQDPADLMTPVLTGTRDAHSFWNLDYTRDLEKRYGQPVEDLNAYMEFVRRDMEWAKEHGAAACKIFIEPQVPLDWHKAHADFKAFLAGQPASQSLHNALFDCILQKAGQMDWPVAVHTGVWGDFRQLDPKHTIDLVQRYPQVRFDIYHLGMPYVRDCIFIAKNFPNAYLNLCWTYILSQSIAEQAINEIVDTVPVNKVFAFGGDYTWGVENVYGHLQMARQSLAEAFSRRIQSGRMNLDSAREILTMWFRDNPASFYRLPV